MSFHKAPLSLKKQHILLVVLVFLLLGSIITGLLTLQKRLNISPRAEADGIGINFNNTQSSGETVKIVEPVPKNLSLLPTKFFGAEIPLAQKGRVSMKAIINGHVTTVAATLKVSLCQNRKHST